MPQLAPGWLAGEGGDPAASAARRPAPEPVALSEEALWVEGKPSGSSRAATAAAFPRLGLNRPPLPTAPRRLPAPAALRRLRGGCLRRTRSAAGHRRGSPFPSRLHLNAAAPAALSPP